MFVEVASLKNGLGQIPFTAKFRQRTSPYTPTTSPGLIQFATRIPYMTAAERTAVRETTISRPQARARTAARSAFRRTARRERRPRGRTWRRRTGLGGRSKSRKRADRAGWLAAITKEINDNIEEGLENISYGREKMRLPKPDGHQSDQDVSQELSDAIMIFLPGKEEELREAIGERIFGDEGPSKVVVPTPKAAAAAAGTGRPATKVKKKGLMEALTSQPLIPIGIAAAFMFLK